METQKRGGTKIVPNHALDTIGIPSEACLPPSIPSLTSYALGYGRALRMIRVFDFSNDLCHMPRVAGAGIYRHAVHHEPLDQTDLKDGVDAS